MRRFYPKYLLQRDLDERGERIAEEAKVAADRLSELADDHARAAARQTEAQRLLSRAQALEDALPRDPESARIQIEDAIRKAAQITHDVDAATEARTAELTQLRATAKRFEADRDALRADVDSRANLLVRCGLGVELAYGTALLLATGGKGAHQIHLDYYSAVATIMPLLLLAGLLELTLLSVGTIESVLAFAIPALLACGAALIVLATHHSSLRALSATLWGFSSTLIALIGLYALHGASGSSGSSD